jgi:hypothetical protein
VKEANHFLKKLCDTKEYVLEVNRLFFFNYGQVITKDGRPKKHDVSNRIKAFDDNLSKIIGIDDRFFWFGKEGKLPVSNEAHEFTIVQINAIRMPRVNSFKEYLDLLD